MLSIHAAHICWFNSLIFYVFIVGIIVVKIQNIDVCIVSTAVNCIALNSCLHQFVFIVIVCSTVIDQFVIYSNAANVIVKTLHGFVSYWVSSLILTSDQRLTRQATAVHSESAVRLWFYQQTVYLFVEACRARLASVSVFRIYLRTLLCAWSRTKCHYLFLWSASLCSSASFKLNGTWCTPSVIVCFLNDSRWLLFAELPTSSTDLQAGRVDSDLISMFAGIIFGLSDVSDDSYHNDLSGESFTAGRLSPDLRRFSISICASMTLRISFLASCSTVGSLRYYQI